MEDSIEFPESAAEEEYEITQFANVLIWFGLCIATAILLWLIVNYMADILVLLLPLPVLAAAGGVGLGRGDVLLPFAWGFVYYATLFSPVLIWRPPTTSELRRILGITARVHAGLMVVPWLLAGLLILGFVLTGGWA